MDRAWGPPGEDRPLVDGLIALVSGHELIHQGTLDLGLGKLSLVLREDMGFVVRQMWFQS